MCVCTYIHTHARLARHPSSLRAFFFPSFHQSIDDDFIHPTPHANKIGAGAKYSAGLTRGGRRLRVWGTLGLVDAKDDDDDDYAIDESPSGQQPQQPQKMPSPCVLEVGPRLVATGQILGSARVQLGCGPYHVACVGVSKAAGRDGGGD